MKNTYQIYLISDSTGETIDRIFTALKSQFKNFRYEIHHFAFTRTKNQINEIIKITKKEKKSIILYTLVDEKLSEYLKTKSANAKIPCFFKQSVIDLKYILVFVGFMGNMPTTLI